MITPRKTTFAILSVVVLLLALALGYLAGRSREVSTTTPPGVSQLVQSPVSRSPTPTTSASATKLTTPSSGATDTDDGSSDGPPYSQTYEAKQHWEPVVEGFGKAITMNKGSEKAWLARLKPYATEEVRRSLANVDPGNVPDGQYGEYEILRHGELNSQSKRPTGMAGRWCCT